MSKPSLRELLEKTRGAPYRGICPELDALLERLVEVALLQDTPTATTFRKLRKGLAEANQRLEVRRILCEAWEGRCHEAERGLAEARAELVKARDFWAMYQQSDQTVGDMFSEINADAEIGRLVRGMRIGTRLVCSIDNIYVVDACSQFNQADAKWEWLRGQWRDPAEALRAIQASEEEEQE